MKGSIKLLIALLLLQFNYVVAKIKNDSIESLMDKYHHTHILAFSPKGNWVLAEKRYGRSSDTVMVYNTNGKGKIIGTVIDMKVSRTFLKEQALLSSGVGNAEYWNLSTQQKKQFKDLKKTIGLTETGIFCLLDKKNIVSVYNISGVQLYKIPNVMGFPFTNGKNKMYVKVLNDGRTEIYDISGTKPLKIFSTEDVLDQIQMSDQNLFLTAKIFNSQTQMGSALIINTKSGIVKTLVIPGLRKDDLIAFKEMNNGFSMMVNANRNTQKNKMVEIWYGNDGNLMNTERGTNEVQHNWIIDENAEKTEEISTVTSQKLLPTGNGRHFFSFIQGAIQDYRTLNEHLDASIYDSHTKEYIKLDTIKNAELYLSSLGNATVYRTLDRKWQFYNLLTGQKKLVEGSSLRNPTFSDDDNTIYFESERGLFVYKPFSNEFKSIPETAGKEITIANRIQTASKAGSVHFYKFETSKSNVLLLKMWDENKNETSYVKYKNGKVSIVIPPTKNHLSSALFTAEGHKVVFVEENFNMSPKINFVDRKHSYKSITLDFANDAQAENYLQEIIRYTNIEGKALKGVLFYPANFDGKKKYPMVVKIYQILNNTSNHYNTIGYANYVGFDLRLLVEKGYFVFLPDIVFGEKGTGLSALDCVNSGLDAVLTKTFIDSAKIGLIGHSHGGYETNFIATHSNRFAAYHSGAGNSDIVRSYFSYNYNFHSPFYWQFEDGQYEMPSSFEKNKEIYFKNNPIHYTDKVTAPILLWAGKKDKNIAWDQVMEFYIGLKRHRKNVIALFYPYQGHALGALSPERIDIYYRSLEWWDYFLKDKRNIPWIKEQIKKNVL